MHYLKSRISSVEATSTFNPEDASSIPSRERMFLRKMYECNKTMLKTLYVYLFILLCLLTTIKLSTLRSSFNILASRSHKFIKIK